MEKMEFVVQFYCPVTFKIGLNYPLLGTRFLGNAFSKISLILWVDQNYNYQLQLLGQYSKIYMKIFIIKVKLN